VVVFMGASSLALAVAFHAMRGMYLHAERHLAKAGVASVKGSGYLPPAALAEGAASSRDFCAAKIMGKPLDTRDRGRAP
jgi:hypothetical protein